MELETNSGQTQLSILLHVASLGCRVDKGRGGRKTEEERQKTKESIWRDKQSWEGKLEKMKGRTYQKYNCRKQRLI